MQNKATNGAPFQKIQDACATTGLSRYFLRNGCKDGSVPHIKSGGVYYINIPALLKKLEATQVKGGNVHGSDGSGNAAADVP